MKTIYLKKYKGRKLYAPKGEITEEGTYINLSEVEELIKNGYDLNVVKHDTEEDVTNIVLKEIAMRNSVSDFKLYELIRK